MNNTKKAILVGKILRHLPLPGSYLSKTTELFGVEIEKIESPVICRDRWDEISIIVRDPSDLVEKHILFQGYFEYRETNLVRRSLKPGDVFIDIGANIGWHTLLAAKRTGATGRVIAFEPVSSTFSHLKENISLNNFRNVEALKIACSTTNGSMNIYSRGEDNAGSNSLYPEGSASTLIEEVTVRNGDELLNEMNVDRVDFCKIDVEGSELDVLEGLRGHLRDGAIRKLLIEINTHALHRAGRTPSDLYSLLQESNFKIVDIRYPNRQINSVGDLPLESNLICSFAH